MIRVLIVDDEPLHIEGLVRHIDWEKLGYAPPLTAESGEEALAILGEAQVDVLVTDVSMPEMTGIELLARCRSDYPHLGSIQTLMISGYDEFEFVQEAIHLGVKAYVLKPIKTEEMEEKLAAFRTAIERKQQIERETEALKEKVTGSLEVLHDRFVGDLIEGRLQNGDMAGSWSRLLELPAEPWLFRLFLFGYDRLHDWPQQDARQRILLSEGLMRAVRVGLSGLPGTYIGRTGADEAVVIHLNASPADRARIEKQLSFVQEVIREQYAASLTIGVSRECSRWEEAPLLLKEVKHMVNGARGAGGGLIHYFDRLEATDYHEFQLREENIPEMLRLLEKGEGDQAVLTFNHAFDLLLMKSPVSFSYVQAFGMGLLSELARKFKRPKEDDGEINIRMWQRLIDCTGTAEIREVLLDELSRYARMQQKERAAQQHHLIHNITRYLEDHLLDQVTVKQLGEQFQLNPSYLSVLFKKETGRTISDFVQELRMNRAKALLRDPHMKVYEVAEQVGYQTTAYFAYLFKKTTGFTPQEFRDYHYEE
ncbi:AraC family transcriptional regulator [Paenibacillus mucilaginosus 3016]|uniref:AraC family transcriptional regulator n=1 Tax=Paenibacillus mucilaginosus 3016 TaxID=1116391 RepID=H6NAC4_9BACL|nr:response regulator [Paenibacillus mucilaginosus]AFC29370.1 AraC family transcriptional regulator [Paenibacillus mucilaginosus 3016]